MRSLTPARRARTTRMYKRKRLLLALAIAAGGAAAVSGSSQEPPGTPADPPPARYLGDAIEVIRSHALTRAVVDWERVGAEARRRAAAATSTPQLYPVLRWVLAELGDGHSFLQLDDARRAAERAANGTAPEHDAPAASGDQAPSPYGERMKPEAELLRQGEAAVGFVFMPQGRHDAAFAAAFQGSVAGLAAQAPCGWIVDLRGNGGGDMWPMLAGLGPLVGEGACGAHVGADGDQASWEYRAGKAILRERGVERVLTEVEGAVTPAVDRAAPVAVLIDGGTASSGEAMAVCFRGRPESRSFGERSYGASTATQGFRLPDGANLVLAVATFADRTGATYPRGVPADEGVAIGDRALPRGEDPVVAAALRWLAARPACRGAG